MVFFVILLSVSSTVNSENQSDELNNTIVVLGDSLSAGYGVKYDESWPSLLEQSIKNNNIDFGVINAGISGDTTSGGLYRLPKLLSEHKPKIVILELGGNDGLRGMSIKRVVLKNLEKMIEMIVLTGAETVLVGVELPPNYGELYTDSFEKMFVDLAVKFNLELIKGSIKEMVALDLMQDDGIPPNKLGHQMVEKEVRVKILPMLDQQATN